MYCVRCWTIYGDILGFDDLHRCMLVGLGFGQRLCTHAMYDYYCHYLVPRDLTYMYCACISSADPEL